MVSFAFWGPGTELSWAPGSGEYHRHICTLEQSGSHQGGVLCGFALYLCAVWDPQGSSGRQKATQVGIW